MISRAEGYRRAEGKEELGLACAEDLFEGTLGIGLLRIDDALENRQRGDFAAETGKTIECKGQPIDPDVYSRNFVEVFEVTRSKKHLGGLARLADVLDMDLSELAATPIDDCRWNAWPKHTVLGTPPSVSVSVESIAGSALTVYVNPSGGGQHIYVYDSATLIECVSAEARACGFKRGMGNSNDDTFAVLVDLPSLRWSRDDGHWQYAGYGTESDAIAEIRKHLALGA
jgi:hypothetical protein